MAFGICKIIIAFWHSTGLRPVLTSVGPLGLYLTDNSFNKCQNLFYDFGVSAFSK